MQVDADHALVCDLATQIEPAHAILKSTLRLPKLCVQAAEAAEIRRRKLLLAELQAELQCLRVVLQRLGILAKVAVACAQVAQVDRYRAPQRSLLWELSAQLLIEIESLHELTDCRGVLAQAVARRAKTGERRGADGERRGPFDQRDEVEQLLITLVCAASVASSDASMPISLQLLGVLQDHGLRLATESGLETVLCLL